MRRCAMLSAALLLPACGESGPEKAGWMAPIWATGAWGGPAYQELRLDSSWSAELIVSLDGREVTLRYERDGENCAAGLMLDSVSMRVFQGRELEKTSCDPFGTVVEIRRTAREDMLFCRWQTREGGGQPGYAWLVRR